MTAFATEAARAAADKQAFRALLDCIPDPVFVVFGQDGTLVYCNAAALRWHGSAEGALIGRPFREVCADEGGDSRGDLLAKVRIHGQVFAEQAFRLSDGRVVRADLSASMLPWGGDDLVVAILRDAEYRLAAQQHEIQARELAARLDTIARLSHEINNPLQALIMRASGAGDPEIRRCADAIAAAVRTLRAEAGDRLPAAAATPAAPAAAPAAAVVRADTRRILVADDTESIRTFLALLLRRAFPDAQVDTAADGEEALAAFKQGHPWVILLDMVMPKKTGEVVFEELVQFCRKHRWEEPRVAFCTGYTPPPAILAALGASDRHVCLLKPVDPPDIVETVRLLMKRPDAG